MSRRTIYTLVALVVAFGLGAGAGVVGLLWATGGTTEESTDIQNVAATLSLDGPTPTPRFEQLLGTQIVDINTNLEAVSTQVAEVSSLSEQVAALSTAVSGASIQTDNAETSDNNDNDAAVAEATPEPNGPADAATAETDTEDAEAATTAGDIPERALYRISQDDSTARFFIDEILMGNPTTVEGTTRRVAGDVIVNFSDPPASQIGPIAINARTFRTDQEFRDDAIRGHILETNEFEFIEFNPTGLLAITQEPVSIGDTIEFQVEGDLTIKETTRTVTFDVSVTVTDENQINGLASTMVLYRDYGITINAPPTVGGIEDEVILEIEFVAERVEEEA